VQINAAETDNVTYQQLILFYWWRTPWYNMDRVWFDKLAANTELVNTYNLFSSLFVIYLKISLTFHFIYSRSLRKYTTNRTRGIFHTQHTLKSYCLSFQKRFNVLWLQHHHVSEKVYAPPQMLDLN